MKKEIEREHKHYYDICREIDAIDALHQLPSNRRRNVTRAIIQMLDYYQTPEHPFDNHAFSESRRKIRERTRPEFPIEKSRHLWEVFIMYLYIPMCERIAYAANRMPSTSMYQDTQDLVYDLMAYIISSGACNHYKVGKRRDFSSYLSVILRNRCHELKNGTTRGGANYDALLLYNNALANFPSEADADAIVPEIHDLTKGNDEGLKKWSHKQLMNQKTRVFIRTPLSTSAPVNPAIEDSSTFEDVLPSDDNVEHDVLYAESIKNPYLIFDVVNRVYSPQHACVARLRFGGEFCGFGRMAFQDMIEPYCRFVNFKNRVEESVQNGLLPKEEGDGLIRAYAMYGIKAPQCESDMLRYAKEISRNNLAKAKLIVQLLDAADKQAVIDCEKRETGSKGHESTYLAEQSLVAKLHQVFPRSAKGLSDRDKHQQRHFRHELKEAGFEKLANGMVEGCWKNSQ